MARQHKAEVGQVDITPSGKRAYVNLSREIVKLFHKRMVL